MARDIRGSRHCEVMVQYLTSASLQLLRASSLSFHRPDSLHLDPTTERLSSQYGIFTAADFVNVSMKGRSAESILSIWKNIVCAIGNPNDIQASCFLVHLAKVHLLSCGVPYLTAYCSFAHF